MINRKKNKRQYSLKSTLLSTFLFSVIICLTVGFYHVASTGTLLNDVTAIMDQTKLVSTVQVDLENIRRSVLRYSTTGNPETLENYWVEYDELQEDMELLKEQVSYTTSGIKLKNLHGLIETCIENLEAVVQAKQNGESYEGLYYSLTENFDITNDYIQKILATELQNSAEEYEQMQRSIRQFTGISYTLFGMALIVMVIYIYSLSRQVTQPIAHIGDYAKRMSRGEYDFTIERETNMIELVYLYDAFAVMVKNTQLYLKGLSEKQVLEAELSEGKIKALEKDNLLQQTELKALHAQLDPHFIFNTMNIGAQMAFIKGEDEISDYLENAAEVFRYNLEGLSDATLADEVNHVSAYMGVLTIRMGDKLHYHFNVAEGIDLNQYILPRMTLQPLMENAFIHGVSTCEKGGRIDLSITGTHDMAVVTISNTGNPFPEEKIHKLYKDESGEKTGHASGIGMKNVIKRLQMQSSQERPVEVCVEHGRTNVILHIPQN